MTTIGVDRWNNVVQTTNLCPKIQFALEISALERSNGGMTGDRTWQCDHQPCNLRAALPVRASAMQSSSNKLYRFSLFGFPIQFTWMAHNVLPVRLPLVSILIDKQQSGHMTTKTRGNVSTWLAYCCTVHIQFCCKQLPARHSYSHFGWQLPYPEAMSQIILGEKFSRDEFLHLICWFRVWWMGVGEDTEETKSWKWKAVCSQQPQYVRQYNTLSPLPLTRPPEPAQTAKRRKNPLSLPHHPQHPTHTQTQGIAFKEADPLVLNRTDK